MKAVCWHAKRRVDIEEVPEPKILNDEDIIVKVSSTAICGSDIHLYDGYIPEMKRGDILGHEFMGEVMEVGPGVKNLKTGDRVVVPCIISCGRCTYCQKGLFSLCDNSNPETGLAEKYNGYATAGIFGYSHIYGGYAGGQAEFVRVPFGDFGPLLVPPELPDEKLLFLSDIFPTGYMGAENCEIQGGESIAVFGCGPVGLLAMKSAQLLGAGQIIAIDRFPERLEMARQHCDAETINYSDVDDLIEELKFRTGGRGPDAVIDAVGAEAHGTEPDALVDAIKARMYLTTDRAHVLRQCIQSCRKGGIVSVLGVYVGSPDNLPFGPAFAKGLRFKMGQVNIHKYMNPLLQRILEGQIDPSFVVTHTTPLAAAPAAYEIFKNKEESCVKVILKP